MSDKGGVIAVNGVWCVEKNRKQVLLDVAYLGGVLVHTVNHKLDMAAVQLHKLRLHKLGGVVVPGNAYYLAAGADGFL